MAKAGRENSSIIPGSGLTDVASQAGGLASATVVEPCMMWDDTRSIVAIWYDQGGGFSLGQMTEGRVVTQIVVYRECGEMSHIPWLAVFSADEIVARVPARKVTVCYANQAEPF